MPAPATTRISVGADPYAAAVNASRALFPGGASTVILAPGAWPIYGAVGAGLAADRQAAMLYTTPTAIPAAVLTELRRLAPATILVVGGPSFVSEAVVTAARGVSANVTRISGANIYETARNVFAQQTAAADTVYLAGALTMADAPLATTLASVGKKRVLVVNGHAAPLDSATVQALRAAGTRSIVIVQSTATITAAYETALKNAGFGVSRVTRTDAMSLSATVAYQAGAARTVSLIVNPNRAADLGIAAAVTGATAQPLYYTFPECVPDGIATHITNAGKPLLLLGDTIALAPAVAANTKCSTEKARLESALNAAVRSTMSNYAGSYHVTVRQVGGIGQITSVGGGTRKEPASMMKLFAAYAAYKRIDEGRARSSTVLPSGVTLGVCIYVMIHASDNYCHSDIVHWIGLAEVNRMIRAAGFTNTSYGSVPRGTSVLYAGNRTTSNDLAWLAERLSKGTLLSPAATKAMLTVMRMQIWKSRIPSGIPAGVPQASKPGALWIASGLMQGDTAIVTGPRSTYVLSIIGDNGPPQAALRAISRTVYTHLNGSFGTAASYPVQQMVTRTPSLLRTSPGGSVAVTIPAGVLIQVHDAQRNWYQVQYGSRKLWVQYTGLRNR
ncbi:hypothetical protein OB08_10820 [Microbacterium sp. HJ5]